MAEKLSNDPARLKQELDAANARNRILSKENNAVAKERQNFVKGQEALEDAEAERDAMAEKLKVAEQENRALRQELNSVQKSRDAERDTVENAKRLKDALEAL